MSDTLIADRPHDPLRTDIVAESRGAFSLGAVIAGALAATAVTFILLSLGSGIGFLGASPYSSGPSAKTLTILGALWIVFAQGFGYGAGGYLAGRLRTRGLGLSRDETDFRDGAHGFAAWALGVVMTITMVALGAAFTAGLTAHVGATVGAGAAIGGGAAAGGAAQSPAASYYVDTLFRGTQPGGQAGAGNTAATADERAEVGRIFASGLRDGKLADADRAYLGQLIAARTGIPAEEATRRIDEALAGITRTAKETADAAAKAASYFSFWMFIALLFGAVAATVGGVAGGNQRDENLGEARA